ncbi:MAG TPA: hypothetical protein VKZ81_15675 [Pseudonocardia sp.]|jgi:hypothetical protein|uniref:hypothetical protein n=1 Tax=Pseudonocardia sp. TaxID=60912 RepID=UPI002B4B41F6|nr:hypothetical protein [Pseudonocardia sp.]HLU56898.1 hypothetical protein [Pseudonocardia sp.]
MGEIPRRPDPGADAVAEARWRQARALGRMSAASGIVFAALFVVAMLLLRQAPRLGDPDEAYARFYAGGGEALATLGIHVVPFVGLALLWHLSATRAMLRAVPRRYSPVQTWLQMASGLLFLCMMFVGSAAVAAVALLSVFDVTPLPAPDVARALAAVGYGLMFIFGVRVAGMYMITTTGMAGAAGLLPRWLAVVGYLAAAFLLVTTTYHPVVLLVFPAWVVVVSIALLLRAGAAHSAISSANTDGN